MLTILDAMLEDMADASPAHRPTNFWSTGLPAIVEDLRSRGFSDFRSHPSAHRMYVPLYEHPFHLAHARLVRILGGALDLLPGVTIGARLGQKLRGRDRARADYRLFKAADPDRPPHLDSLSESEIGLPREQFTFESRRYSRSFLNYLRGLCLLKKSADTSSLESALEIGGGYGTLGEILLAADEQAFYVDVDIPPVAAVATYYLRERFGADAVLGYDRSRRMDVLDVDEIRRDHRCAVLCPWQLPRLRGPFDLFANFISFQEMEPDVVRGYVDAVAPLTRSFVLLRNSRHGKPVAAEPGKAGVLNPITTEAIVAMFSGFETIARDAEAFGHVSPDGAFVSEVVCLERRRHA